MRSAANDAANLFGEALATSIDEKRRDVQTAFDAAFRQADEGEPGSLAVFGLAGAGPTRSAHAGIATMKPSMSKTAERMGGEATRKGPRVAPQYVYTARRLHCERSPTSRSSPPAPTSLADV